MKNLFKRYKTIQRKDSIDAVQGEMKYLKKILHDALLNRGNLDHVQRMMVLSDLVDDVKAENSRKLLENTKKAVESEKSSDIVKNILMFNLF